VAAAKVEEVSATSTKSLDDAITEGLARAVKTLRNVRRAWVKEQHVRLDGKKVVEYQGNMVVTFVLDDWRGYAGKAPPGSGCTSPHTLPVSPVSHPAPCCAESGEASELRRDLT
jgi:dodecin